jgi:hypothetical protein
LVTGTGIASTAAIAVFSLVMVPKCDPLAVLALVRTLSSKDISGEARVAAREKLQLYHPSIVLPALLAELERIGPFNIDLQLHQFPFNPVDDKPVHALHRAWSDVFYADLEVRWYDPPLTEDNRVNAEAVHTGPAWRRAAIGRSLFAMMSKTKSRESWDLMVTNLPRFYTPEAETLLARIMRSSGGHLHADATQTLIANQPRKYAGEVIDRIPDLRRFRESRQSDLVAFNRQVFDQLESRDQKRLIRAGFAFLADHPSYSVAIHLSSLVDVRFTPDGDDPRHRDGAFRSQAYLDDTVKNALDWWAAWREAYE